MYYVLSIALFFEQAYFRQVDQVHLPKTLISIVFECFVEFSKNVTSFPLQHAISGYILDANVVFLVRFLIFNFHLSK